MIILDKDYSERSCWHYLRKKLVTVWSHNVALNSALTLLIGEQERHPACRNWVVRYWHGYLPGARCKWFVYGPADATATPSSLAPVKSRMVYLSGVGLPRLSWRKGRCMDVVVVGHVLNLTVAYWKWFYLEHFKRQEEDQQNDGWMTLPSRLDWSCVKQYIWWPKIEKCGRLLHLAPTVTRLLEKRE